VSRLVDRLSPSEPMSTATRQRIRLDFGNLPLVEAAVRASLESPVPLKFATINSVKERLAPDFPRLEEPERIEVPPGVSDAGVSFGPGQIPGAVYAGNARGLIVTLQSQVIVARWLKKATENGYEYPRFQSLSHALWRTLDAMTEVSGQRLPRVVVVNISYVNFLAVPHTEPVLSTYFSEMAHVRAALDAEQVLKVEASWRERGAIDLRFDMVQVTAQVGEESIEGYRLTTAAGTRLTGSCDPRACLDKIHDRLQVFFADLISERAKNEWQLKEIPLG
jgi:uncharacterized protein (TIGR04255 family)